MTDLKHRARVAMLTALDAADEGLALLKECRKRLQEAWRALHGGIDG